MEEEEHEVYGGEIPDVEGDMDAQNADVDMSAADDDAVKVLFLFLEFYLNLFCFQKPQICQLLYKTCMFVQELDEMKKRLKEMEEEAAALREMQAKVEKEMGAVQGFYFSLIDFILQYYILFLWIWNCFRIILFEYVLF